MLDFKSENQKCKNNILFYYKIKIIIVIKFKINKSINRNR